MSCSCVKIFLRTSPKRLPEFCYDQYGRVQLDTNELELDKVKSTETLNVLDNISADGVLGFLLLDTAKNRAILKHYGGASFLLHNQKALLPVYAVEAGRTLRQDNLSIVERNKDGWEVDLIDGSSFWKTGAEEVRICDCDFGVHNFELNETEDNWRK